MNGWSFVDRPRAGRGGRERERGRWVGEAWQLRWRLLWVTFTRHLGRLSRLLGWHWAMELCSDGAAASSHSLTQTDSGALWVQVAHSHFFLWIITVTIKGGCQAHLRSVSTLEATSCYCSWLICVAMYQLYSLNEWSPTVVNVGCVQSDDPQLHQRVLKAQRSQHFDFLCFIYISTLWGWNNTVKLWKWS